MKGNNESETLARLEDQMAEALFYEDPDSVIEALAEKIKKAQEHNDTEWGR